MHSDCWILAPARSRLKNSFQHFFHGVAMQAPDAYIDKHLQPIRHIRVPPGREGRREAFKTVIVFFLRLPLKGRKRVTIRGTMAL